MTTLTTDRLVLRQWRDSDRDEFAALCADTEVMRHFPAPLDRTQADALADRASGHIAEHGWGLWAVEHENSFIGFTGLASPQFDSPFTAQIGLDWPPLEVGWRLARPSWGHGFATEAARAALDFAFGELGRSEVVSFTTHANQRSRAVMQRLGMTRDKRADFEHPRIAVGHPLRAHVLYRLTSSRWRS